jgi:hypothetical protein
LNVTGTTSLADGTVAVAELDIDGATDIGAGIADADLLVIDDGAGGTNRKTAASRLKTYILADNSIDSDMYVDGSIDLAHMSANSIDSDQYVDGSIDNAHYAAASVTADKTSGVIRPNAKPIIINGDMAVAQRGTSATGKTASGYYACDRIHLNISSLGTWTIAQETLTSGNAYADGFQKAFRFDCTTADASPSAGDHCLVRQKFEGQDVQVFKKGTANAETYTLAFWVKSNKTGTDIFTCGLYDHDNTRSVFQNYTISSADTWEYKVLNFPADTTGVMDDDNAVSIDVRWYLGAGSNFTGGTQATSAWESNVAANQLPSGKVNIADSTSNDIAITGVQLEVGTYTSSTIPPFQHESYGDNLHRCQRYYQLIADDAADLIGMTASYNGTTSYSIVRFPTEMRSDAVTVEQDTGTNYYSHLASNSNTGFNSFGIDQTRANAIRISAATNKTQGDAGYFESTASGKLAVEDEL